MIIQYTHDRGLNLKFLDLSGPMSLPSKLQTLALMVEDLVLALRF